MNTKKGYKAWLSERFPLSTFDYEVPPHANTLPFSLGGITLICVVVLIITGFLLSQMYIPQPEAANQSIRYLMTQVRFGSLIRSIHVWAANLAIACLILHLLRVLFYGSYRKPRELNWLFGVGLFVLMISLYFTGTVIKWDQEGYEALAHVVAIGKMLGGPFATYFAPNDTSLLSKFFSLHTSILPLLLITLFVFHAFLIKELKISPLPWASSKAPTGRHTFAHHFVKLGGYFFIVVGLLIALAVFFPAPIGPSPVKGIESSRPAWPFMAIFSVENWYGIAGLIYGAFVVVLLLLLVPLLDRARSHLMQERKAMVAVSALAVVILAGLTVNAYVTKPKQHIGMGGGNEKVAAEAGPAMSTPQVIAMGLRLTESLKAVISKHNAKAAAGLAEKLDATLDPLKDAISEKNPGLVSSLDTDSLLDALKGGSPDFAKASTLAETMEKGLQQARTIFPVTSTVDRINQDLKLISEIKTEVAAKDYKSAIAKAENLDEGVDPLKDIIGDKNPKLVKALDVEALTDQLKASSPDVSGIDSTLEAMNTALARAKPLLSTSKK